MKVRVLVTGGPRLGSRRGGPDPLGSLVLHFQSLSPHVFSQDPLELRSVTSVS